MILVVMGAIFGIFYHNTGLVVAIINQSRYKKANCSAAIVVDDFQNGNATNDNEPYFIGFNRLPT